MLTYFRNTLRNSSITEQWQTICSENATCIFICVCNAEAKRTCGHSLARGWPNLYVLSGQLVKLHFPEFFTIRESHVTEVWLWQCGWKWRMLPPGLVTQPSTKYSSSCIPFLLPVICWSPSCWKSTPDGNFPVTMGKTVHLPLNPLTDCHMPVTYFMVYDMNKR